ncbi:hypothetical protein GCM10022215_32530 [Nocardioides fonticola]|uniref:XRE family transcriptional regulator n=1 Tax=Nocardioides fonticola TaxID=450363 RepID=A0ABP7XS82_9ACTN
MAHESPSAQVLARLPEHLVLEIKAEMGRRDLSSRALGRLIGQNSQYMSFRLDGGNPRTGERVPLNVRDLAAIASALNLDPAELMERATVAALEEALQVVDIKDFDRFDGPLTSMWVAAAVDPKRRSSRSQTSGRVNRLSAVRDELPEVQSTAARKPRKD